MPVRELKQISPEFGECRKCHEERFCNLIGEEIDGETAYQRTVLICENCLVTED